MPKRPSKGSSSEKAAEGVPKPGQGGSNKGGSGQNPQNTNTKGQGAQKRQQQKKR
jgi:hypothetical protein